MNRIVINKLVTSVFVIIFSLLVTQVSAKSLQDYVPVLPETLAKRLTVDPKKGYLVQQIKPDVYLMTDGIWQSVFITTGKGVILIDAPQSYGKHIKAAVSEVTKEPIKTLVYTHTHVDHIGGSTHLRGINNLKIISSKHVANYLKEKQDPRRLVPTNTFQKNYVINIDRKSVV